MTIRAPYIVSQRVTGAQTSQPTSSNPNLNTNPVPFVQSDWPNPTLAVPRFSSIISLEQRGINPNLFTNPVPFKQSDWANPVLPKLKTSDDPRSINLNLITPVILVPFSQYDWPNPTLSPSRQSSIILGSVSSNLNIFLNPIPFSQPDWPNPVLSPSRQNAITSEDGVWQNPIIFTSPPPPVIVVSAVNPWIAGMGRMMNR